ncbi:hypothetical protein ACFX2B_039442 [Malus domestica]|uniref:uncharacterized protein n=1 Tax=Malus domestica TaxID=3750 RepID=UPI000498B5C6|nr:uncharacterized protein LOC103409988 isoform X1 [Malus domestica]
MESSLQRMESSSSSSSVPKFPQPKRGLIKANIFGNLVKTTTSMSSHREQLDKSLLSEENIPLVTLDAAPNDAEEKHVPYAATRDSEAPADNLAKPNSEENIQLVTLNAAPNDAKEEQVTYAAARDSEAPADNLAKPNSEDNIQLVTFNVAPNERQVPYAAAKESEAPADNLAKPNSEELIFLVTSLCMEILSAACDQASSPGRPRYALFGMLLAIGALLIFICELIYKGRKNKVVWRKMGCCMLFGSVIEIFGLFGGISQCVCSIIQYVYYIRRAENPIKLSLLPAIFLICLIATRLNRTRMQTRDETGEHIAKD